ncbi:probable G-protein coupled receptor 174 [Hyla sarda]|uniref:probable G-protein coupled receptor 174 n=1 Tax=Hyla sarda TaxID=327740 RepID=UPI0024C21350|nr:probable G-protein coupled receptor 174 [Hyla sarda]XP_056395356.1 probable G-protein coupled receptor 174 [Hyla sarda]XP_056395357.1 probable G-protein coupled receptor 174 [Hyla sarda]XP_056395358.1 probable G-protein coupled receptor 174 [Hyla sarda]XP_056395359.1 probable G-protein coupled receptor 174 [Hyla sarda]
MQNDSNVTDGCEVDGRFLDYLYATTYAVILIPGLIGNVLALWVFYVYMKETKRAVIFMINLAIADLLQVLSLPLRIFYYLHKSWPFGRFLCMFCFYLKYVNMYASIFFLVCISVRRFMYLIYPFRFTDRKRMFDIYVSVAVWIVVCVGCLPFPLLRLENGTNSGNDGICFVDLPLKDIGVTGSIMAVTVAELFGFVSPLVIVLFCTWRTVTSLREPHAASHDLGEKKKALKMILTCAAVFLICFAPYHLSFPLDFLAKANRISSCSQRRAILTLHPVALCLASMNCCLDPVIYYFTTDEFKRRLSRQDLVDGTELQILYNKNFMDQSICRSS